MRELDSRRLHRSYLILRATRWFPTGLVIPVFILFLIDRGLTLGQIGVVTAAQGVVVLALELPTGGLADAIGRKEVLLVANVFELVSIVMILLAPRLPWFIVAFALMGVYRALESGPLDSWFVDGVHQIDPGGGIERGMSHGGVVVGLALASGAIVGGGLVAWDPFSTIDALAAPIAVSLVFRVLDTVMLTALMSEIRAASGIAAAIESARDVPHIIKSAFASLHQSLALRLLMTVEITWGFGAVAWEGLFPAKLGQVVGADGAASLMGPLTAAAWAASAGGSAAVMWFSRRLGRHLTAAWIRVIQAGTVTMMAAFGGVVDLTIGFFTCYAMLGASSPVHMTLVHDEAEAYNRTTISSLNNMSGMAAAAVAGIVLGVLADVSTISVAMIVAAVVVVAAAPLYLLARARPTVRTPIT